jgi:hypothetical protein
MALSTGADCLVIVNLVANLEENGESLLSHITHMLHVMGEGTRSFAGEPWFICSLPFTLLQQANIFALFILSNPMVSKLQNSVHSVIINLFHKQDNSHALPLRNLPHPCQLAFFICL